MAMMRKLMNTQHDRTYENQYMHRELQEWEWTCAWVTSRHALSRNRVRAQLRNNLMHVTDQNKSIMHGSQINQSVNQS